MKPFLVLMAATALAAFPAGAQMNMPGMEKPHSSKKPAAEKSALKKRPAKKKLVRRWAKTAAKKASTHVHAAVPSMPGMEKPDAQTMHYMPRMDMSHQHNMPQTQAPAAGTMQDMRGMQMPHEHKMPGRQAPVSGSMQDMPGMNMPSSEHAGHNAATMEGPEPPVAPPPPQALEGPENAADGVYGGEVMRASRSFLMTREHGGLTASKLFLDQLETRFRKGRDGYYLNAQAWHGGDIDKLWLKTEVEGDYGRKAERAEFQALWSHAVDPWWDLQAGVRLDAAPGTHGRLALGVEGLASYWIETEATAFVSTKGDVTARVDAEHDIRITQKLILQPRAELNFSLQDITSERIGSGLSRAELGLRLRYAVVPNFAPYVGVIYERAVGRTATLVRQDGERPGGVEFATGLRFWF